MKKKNIFIGLALSLAVTGCGKEALENTNNNVKEEVKQEENEEVKEAKTEKKDESKVIYASFYPIYNLTKQIAGDKFEVKSFNSLTTESHDFEPSAKEIAELSDSQLIFMNGAGMEDWKDDVNETIDISMVDTSESLKLIKADHEDAEDHDHDHEDAEDHDHDHEDAEDHDHDHDHEEDEHHHHHHGEFDPHTWLSPVNAKAQAKVIADKLSEIDPANEDYYQKNYEEIAKEFDEIINEYKEKFAKVENKKFIVPHEAFGYVARDFNLEQIPLASLTSTADPDAKVMKEVTDLAKASKIKTIFFEKGGSDKAAKTIAEEIGAETAPLSTMEFASEEEIEKEVTIQEIIKENLENIYKSLA